MNLWLFVDFLDPDGLELLLLVGVLVHGVVLGIRDVLQVDVAVLILQQLG